MSRSQGDVPGPARDELERLQRALTGVEPVEHSGYLMVPREGRLYASGAGVPLLGATRIEGQGELLRVGPGRDPAPIDYLGVYLTIDEYLPEASEVPGDLLVEHWASQASPVEMLGQLAVLNRAVRRPELLEDMVSQFEGVLAPAVAERFTNVMRGGDGNRRWFLARQPILIAMRAILEREPAPLAEPTMPPLLAATLLTHAVAMGLSARARAADSDVLIGGHPAHLAMEIIRNELFHAGEDTYALMDRHVRLWRHFGPRAGEPTPRSVPAGMLAEATGAELEDLLAGGFAVWAHANSWQFGNPVAMSLPITEAFEDREAAFLALVGRSVEDFRDAVRGGPTSTWDLLVFQQTPVLLLEGRAILLDEDFLLDRVTTGLYWEVHDHEKNRSETDRLQWTQVYGQMIDLQVEESVNALAPPSLRGDPMTFDEDAVAAAYPGKVCDRVVDRGDTLLLFEIVSGRLTVASRVDGDVAAFEADTEKLVIKKARQLDAAGRSLHTDGAQALTGLPRSVPLRILPVVVVAGGFGGYPINPTTVEYIRERIGTEDLFEEAWFDALCVIDAGEVELLEGLNEHGHDPCELLRGWQQSSLWRMPFRNWVFATIGNSGPTLRPGRMTENMESLFDDLVSRLGFVEGDDDAELP